MLSGPRRAQAGSHLPKNRPDTRCGESRKRPTTGPCGELATHFMGLLVCADWMQALMGAAKTLKSKFLLLLLILLLILFLLLEPLKK